MRSTVRTPAPLKNILWFVRDSAFLFGKDVPGQRGPAPLNRVRSKLNDLRSFNLLYPLKVLAGNLLAA